VFATGTSSVAGLPGAATAGPPAWFEPEASRTFAVDSFGSGVSPNVSSIVVGDVPTVVPAAGFDDRSSAWAAASRGARASAATVAIARIASAPRLRRANRIALRTPGNGSPGSDECQQPDEDAEAADGDPDDERSIGGGPGIGGRRIRRIDGRLRWPRGRPEGSDPRIDSVQARRHLGQRRQLHAELDVGSCRSRC